MQAVDRARGTVQLLVIGGGPAGLAAASRASESGVAVILLDEQETVGGQIYRAIEKLPPQKLQKLGPDYIRGKALAQRFSESAAEYQPNSQVWAIEPLDNHSGYRVYFSQGQAARHIDAEMLVLAGGAMERPVPFPGWTLPGVMNAGAGQILYKAHNIVPDSTAVLAGSGPLLLLLAWQYLQAGVKVQGILDMTPAVNHWRAIKHLPKALAASAYLLKGLKYEWDLKRAGVPFYRDVSHLQAVGDNELQKVTFTQGKTKTALHTAHLFVHFGVIPANQLTQIAGCEHHWDDSQRCWKPRVDTWGQSSQQNLLVAGDGAGIGGAAVAELSGELAALKVAFELGELNGKQRDTLAKPLFKLRAKDQKVRPFLEAYFRVPADLLGQIPDETLVCRCEEVSARDIRSAVNLGHGDVNQVKFLTRCGMGPCQGRQCGHAVSHVIAAELDQHPSEAGAYRARPPSNALSLGHLAQLYIEDAE